MDIDFRDIDYIVTLPFYSHIIIILNKIINGPQPKQAHEFSVVAEEFMEHFFKTDCAIGPRDKERILYVLNEIFIGEDDVDLHLLGMTDYELVKCYVEETHIMYEEEDIIDEMIAKQEKKKKTKKKKT